MKKNDKKGGGLINDMLHVGLDANKMTECSKQGKVWTNDDRCGFFRSSSGCCVEIGGGKINHKKRTSKKRTSKKRTYKKRAHLRTKYYY